MAQTVTALFAAVSFVFLLNVGAAEADDLRDQVFMSTGGRILPEGPDDDGNLVGRFRLLLTNTKSKSMSATIIYNLDDNRGGHRSRAFVQTIEAMTALHLDPETLVFEGKKYKACDSVALGAKITVKVQGQRDLVVAEKATVTITPCDR